MLIKDKVSIDLDKQKIVLLFIAHNLAA